MLRFKYRLWRIADRLFGLLVRAVFALLRVLGPDAGPRIGAFLTRNLGPLTSANRIARDNIAAAFPEKTEAERAAILREAWDNLGRVACEYVHMDRIWDFDPTHPESGRITATPETVALYERLREDGKPAIVFSAHLANWELPAIAAAKHGIDSAVLYRTPNSPAVAKEILRLRRDSMGTLVAAGMSAPFKLAKALERGKHIGMLVDQRFGRGPRIEFLGRPAHANPLMAQLARRYDCPVHGARAIRLPDGRFRLDLTEEIALPRDAEGLIDVAAATQAMNDVIAGWVREYPGQWLWMHRRWR
ncbi:lipid A biosynthesis lauroyl acyltransferase [Neoroseomonas soli]|uniref:Lipid A biosynthesis lauroyl acyltransferase n=1 Tax=Neoroseomonas soli TaxID=1081025 RepID=A0A9X9WVU1_9PROT|nr:lipid A biosynthesis lauroyl acyltransferase [Neoroseomonas soli]MBR0671270.1 lipid A biosynthesis lauroyl acyltransferase [Neoroseomonas soli]